MTNKWLERHPLIVFVSISTTGLAILLLCITVLWAFAQVLGFRTSLWAMIEALSTAIAAAAVLGAGFVASRELNELSSSRYLEVADRLFEELNSPESVAARRWLFQNLPDDPEEGIRILTSEGRDAIKSVLNSLDRVAFLSQTGWIPEEMFMPWMSTMVVKAWAKLGPYVEYERQRRYEPDYYKTASTIAQQCIEWRQRHVPDARIIWIENAL